MLLASPVSAQYNWCEIHPGVNPPARAAFGMTYDADANRPILFGGYNSSGPLGDTWELRRNDWAEIFTTQVPPARYFHTFTYGVAEKGSILFGGISGDIVFGDVWKYANGKWTDISSTSPDSPDPPARHSHAAAYDDISRRLIIYGGLDENDNHLADMWSYQNGTWSEIGYSEGPGPLYGHATAFDTSRGKLVLFGGADIVNHRKNETWVYTPGTWTKIDTAHAPSPRVYHKMVYDSDNGQILLFGGFEEGARTNDVWAFDGNDWTQISTRVSPKERSAHELVYDSRHKRAISFGGITDSTDYRNDTWFFYKKGISFDKPIYIGTHDSGIITVNDQDANINSNVRETISTSLTSTSDPDGIIVTLKETEPDSGVFTFEKGGNLVTFTLEMSDEEKVQIKVSDGDKLIVTYRDIFGSSPVTATVRWARSPVVIKLDKDIYVGKKERAQVIIYDDDLNKDANTTDTFWVQVTSTTDPNGFGMLVRETGVNTGIFAPDFGITFSNYYTDESKHQLWVSDGDVLTVSEDISMRKPARAMAIWDSGKISLPDRPATYIVLGPEEGEVTIQTVTFHFTASIPISNAEFRTQLVGYDEEWTPWTQGSIRQYELPAGEYTFIVQVRNSEKLVSLPVFRRFQVETEGRAALFAPNLKVVAGDNSISLQWNQKNPTDILGYYIYRREEGKNNICILQYPLLPEARAYTNAPVQPHIRYEYFVRVISNDARLKDSNKVWTAANEDVRGNDVLAFTNASFDMGNNLNETTLEITNQDNSEPIYWSLYADNAALGIFPASGIALGKTTRVEITLDRSGFAPGVHSITIHIRSNARSYLPTEINSTNSIKVSFSIPGEFEHTRHNIWVQDACPEVSNVLVDLSPLDLDCNIPPVYPLIKTSYDTSRCPFRELWIDLRTRANGGPLPNSCPDLGWRFGISTFDTSKSGSEGNLNGQIDRDEDIAMFVSIRNKGSIEARSLSLILYSPDPFIEVTRDPKYILNNVPGGWTTRGGVTFYTRKNLPFAPDGYDFTLYCLLIDTDGYQWLTTIPLKAFNMGPVKVVRYGIDDDNEGISQGNDNGIVEAGETIEMPVTIYNPSDVELPQIAMILDDVTTPTTIEEFLRAFVRCPAPLYPHSSKTPDRDFEFFVPDAYDGSEIDFRISSIYVKPEVYDNFCPDPDYVVYLGYTLPDPDPPDPENPADLPVYGIVYRYRFEDVFSINTQPIRESEVTFDEGDEGWQFSGDVDTFTSPVSGWENGSIYLQAANNTNCFGFWDSGAGVVPIVKYNLYRARWTIHSDQADFSKTPAMRLRAYDNAGQQYDSLCITSDGNGAFAPDTQSRNYDLYFFPNNDAGENLGFAFDLINMAPDDAAQGKVYLDNLVIARRPLNLLPDPLRIRHNAFDTDEEGWTFNSVPEVFTPPTGDYYYGTLWITGTDSNTFGFWCNPINDITLGEDMRLYRAEFIVRRDSDTEQDKVPTLRLRINAMDNQSGVGKKIVSEGGGEASPTTSNRAYDLFYFSPTDKDGNPVKDVPLRLSFDYINLSDQDNPAAALKLDEVNVFLYPPDAMP